MISPEQYGHKQLTSSIRCNLYFILLVLLIVLFGSYFSPHSFDASDWVFAGEGPSWANSHWFGTDDLGRDLFVRTLKGGQISLLIGISGTLVATAIGLIYGALSALAGGYVDSIMMRIVDVLQSVPVTFFVIAMVAIFGRSLLLILLIAGLVTWPDLARIIRGQTLSLSQRPFICAARMSGCTNFSILINHILPNLSGVILASAMLQIPHMILLESFLSFLGLGVQEPMTSWGALIQEGMLMMSVSPSQLIFPGGFLIITLLSFNFLGENLRRALDSRYACD